MKIHVISWNIYSKDKFTINKTKVNQLLTTLDETVDILIVSLQEIGNLKYVVQLFKNHDRLQNFKMWHTNTGKNSLYNSGFEIGLFMFISKGIIDNIKVITSINKCITRQGNEGGISRIVCTKGITGFKIKDIETGKHYLFLGCHLPVFNIKYTETALKVLNRIIDKSTIPSDSIVVAGDFNSRLPPSNLNYPDILSKFNTMELKVSKKQKKRLEKDLSKKKSSSSSRTKSSAITQTNRKTRASKEGIDSYFTFETKNKNTTKKLVKVDTLNNFFNKILNKHLKESTINFPPTYKFNHKTGEYLKDYTKVSRFPGYADRIFYSNLKYYRESYTSMFVKGSDHMPIMIKLKSK
jgi:endonuclease/exonuclease/phosphatase family metal-dependent hydrolase